jgi:hypothetical protein
MLNRIFVAAAVISAVSFVGTSVPANAQQQQDQKPPPPQKPRPQKPAPQPQPQPAQPQKPQPQRPPEPAQPQRQPQRGQAQPRQMQQRLPQQQQQQLIGQQQQRLVQYGAQLDQQQRLLSQQATQLQQQHRAAQSSFQLQYVAGLRDQQLSLQNARNYNYGGDPYFYTPPSYRYNRGGRFYETNDYGANVLRQAVNNGYAQGFGAGRADRLDRWPFNYQNSYPYQDANYGYRGFYVERDDYNYYFREGFRRGYEDGYYGRSQYGVYATGKYAVLGAVLSAILNLQSLR